MIFKGIHLNVGDGVDSVLKQIDELQIQSFQLFLENPLSWTEPKNLYRFQSLIEKARNSFGVQTVFVHSPYLVHLGSKNASTRTKSWKKLKEDLPLATDLGIDGYVVHLDIQQMSELQSFEEEYSKHLSTIAASVPILFENVASKAMVGSDPYFVLNVIDVVREVYPAALCLDSAHLAAAGYDIQELIEKQEFMFVLQSTKLVHLNDLKSPIGSSRDAHQNVGQGTIGYGPLKKLVKSLTSGTSVILETPQENVDALKKDLLALTHMIAD
jgi:deoxyribonuclease-4